jgi:hypothetical protein
VLSGTLGQEGDYAPTVSLLQADGKAIAALIASGVAVTANLTVTLSEILT